MRLGSLFAGIGGFDRGFELAGFQPVWAVEIDPACQRVLRHHFPNLHIESDVREVGAHNLEPVDVITFGSPCQDLSVAGKRGGFAGERSGLYFEAIRIIRELSPAIAVWENVPGALSSHNGRDFGRALDELADIGALDIGWAVLDAQWFGVAQRRRRVFVVADFRGQRAGEILALADGLSGHPAPRRETGQDVAGTLTDCAGQRGWSTSVDHLNFVPTIAPALTSNYGKQPDNSDTNAGPMVVPFDMTQVTSVANRQRLEAGREAPSPHAAGGAHVIQSVRTANTSANGHGVADDVAHTIDGANGQAIAFNWQTGGDMRLGISSESVTALGTSQTPAIAFSSKDHGADAGDIAPTLRAMPHDASHANGGGQVAVAFKRNSAVDIGAREELAPTMHIGTAGVSTTAVQQHMAVRRLTPTECERLQGFPDGWTAVDGAADSTRYRQLGNAVAVPVAAWLARRIVAADRLSAG